MRRLAPIFLLALLFAGCSPRETTVPYTFLDSLTFPFDTTLVFVPGMARTFEINRAPGESVDLILPPGGTQQDTWLFHKDYLPGINDDENIIAKKRAAHDGRMVYNLDTLEDGRYVMSTVGDGYGGDFLILIMTK